VVFAEELGKSTFSGFAIASLVHTDMASVHLLNAGNVEQKEKYLADIVSGNKISCVAVTEPHAGSDVKNIRTKAQKVGNKYLINGSKIFITNGVHADIYFVAAKTSDGLQQSGNITMFIVRKDNPGLIVNKQLDKHGWRCSDTAELFFQDCEVEESDVLGTINKGFYAIMQNFQNERLVMGSMAMGEAQAAIDITVDYVKYRDAFGGKLWEKQTVRHKLAELQSKVTAARYMVYGVANKVRLGIDVIKEVSMIKVLCGELVNEVMYACLQLHGGTGYMTGTEIERLTRDARAQSIGGGATEVMLEEVAKRM
jgi:acyl-CoA dehydrogenase